MTKLKKMTARCYRSLREVEFSFQHLNLLIGANATGKSTILDALCFLHEAVRFQDFASPFLDRGGFSSLAWKGSANRKIELITEFSDDDALFRWSVELTSPSGLVDLHVREELVQINPQNQSQPLLSSNTGDEGWWISGSEQKKITLEQPFYGCALAAASADADFPARRVAKFLNRWGFFDPTPIALRRTFSGTDSSRLDTQGRNLAERLYQIKKSDSDKFHEIVRAAQSVLGFPVQLEFSGRNAVFSLMEEGLEFPVFQSGVSSGTLRMLALMTALLDGTESRLLGIEEPENHIHPTALSAFADFLKSVGPEVQLVVTTHSPLLLDYLNDPGIVSVIRRDVQQGTIVQGQQSDIERIKTALEQSGFGLGEFYETTGFGG